MILTFILHKGNKAAKKKNHKVEILEGKQDSKYI